MGSQSTGQGHDTSYSQIIAQRLGVPPGRVRVIQGDGVNERSIAKILAAQHRRPNRLRPQALDAGQQLERRLQFVGRRAALLAASLSRRSWLRSRA